MPPAIAQLYVDIARLADDVDAASIGLSALSAISLIGPLARQHVAGVLAVARRYQCDGESDEDMLRRWFGLPFKGSV